MFLDAVKADYRTYVELTLPRLAPGGTLVADNLLRGGRVAEDFESDDVRQESIDALRLFNPGFVAHPDLVAQVLPLGDGTGLAHRRR